MLARLNQRSLHGKNKMTIGHSHLSMIIQRLQGPTRRSTLLESCPYSSPLKSPFYHPSNQNVRCSQLFFMQSKKSGGGLGVRPAKTIVTNRIACSWYLRGVPHLRPGNQASKNHESSMWDLQPIQLIWCYYLQGHKP